MTSVRSGLERVIAGETSLGHSGPIALLSNRSARSGRDWSGEALRKARHHIAALLTPEHGLAATAGAGEPIGHSSLGDLPVLSMYGADSAPIEEELAQVEALVIDLPDVGCRYYTYEWTMREAIKMAQAHGLPVIVLDRPNPLGGERVEGDLPGRIDSAVCASPVPIRHGLTLGELALWQGRMLDLDVDLSVIPAAGWRRALLWDQTDLPWVPPSPALTSFQAALAYPGTCLIEGTNVSEGRGTESPFLKVGAPFVDGAHLVQQLREEPAFEGANLHAHEFVPSASKWAGERCGGIRIEIHDAARFQPVRAGLALVIALRRIAEFAFRPAHFDALTGGSAWREGIEAGSTAKEIADGWEGYEARFLVERSSVLLYE